jgi:hypothetical protein
VGDLTKVCTDCVADGIVLHVIRISDILYPVPAAYSGSCLIDFLTSDPSLQKYIQVVDTVLMMIAGAALVFLDGGLNGERRGILHNVGAGILAAMLCLFTGWAFIPVPIYYLCKLGIWDSHEEPQDLGPQVEATEGRQYEAKGEVPKRADKTAKEDTLSFESNPVHEESPSLSSRGIRPILLRKENCPSLLKRPPRKTLCRARTILRMKSPSLSSRGLMVPPRY